MRNLQRLAVTALVAMSLASLAQADAFNWNLDGDGAWADGASWSPDSDFPGNGDDATFGPVLIGPAAVSGGNQTASSLTFDSAQPYTLNLTGLTVQAANPTAGLAVVQGHHTINAPVIPAGNGGLLVSIADGASLTVDGTFLAPAQSGRGFRIKSGGGEFRVTGQAATSGWFGMEVQAGTMALEGGLVLRNSYNAQNNKNLTVSSGATLRAGGTFGSDTNVYGSPNLILNGSLDVFGELLWSDGHLNLANGQQMLFEVGTDVLKYYADSAGSDGTASPTLTGPNGSTIELVLSGTGVTPGVYDLIDWTGGTNITVNNLDLADFTLTMPAGWAGQLQFDDAQAAGKLQLDLTAVPEPATLALLGLGLPALLRRRR